MVPRCWISTRARPLSYPVPQSAVQVWPGWSESLGLAKTWGSLIPSLFCSGFRTRRFSSERMGLP